MDHEMLQYLTQAACNRIDKLIDAMPKPASNMDFRDVNDAIQRVRNHLESRAAQTAVPFVPPTSAMLADAKPVVTAMVEPEVSPALSIDLYAAGMDAALAADAEKLEALVHFSGVSTNNGQAQNMDSELKALLGL